MGEEDWSNEGTSDREFTDGPVDQGTRPALEALYQKRYENNYDIPDPDYLAWVKKHYGTPTSEEETPTHSIQPNQEAQLQSTFAYAPHSLPDPAISPIPPPRKRKARWQHKQFVNINEAFKRDGLSRSKYIHCA